MTINSLQVNNSTVVGGLGTQTFNVVTTGNYTCSFKSFIPYLAAGGQPVTTQPTQNIQTITTVADSSGSLNSTYWTFYSAGALQGFYVWYNINSAGVDPAPAGLTGIQVTGATNVTANNIASATRTAIAANAAAAAYVTVTGATNNIILTDIQPGTTTAAANGTASPGFSYATGTIGSYGVPAISGLNIVINQNSTVLARYGFPSPTQPIMGGSVVISATAGDVIAVVFSSQSTADAAPNAVKSIVNLYQGIGN
jgi:hypothetical protein